MTDPGKQENIGWWSRLEAARRLEINLHQTFEHLPDHPALGLSGRVLLVPAHERSSHSTQTPAQLIHHSQASTSLTELRLELAARGGTLGYTYDPLDNLTSLTEPGGPQTTFDYNADDSRLHNADAGTTGTVTNPWRYAGVTATQPPVCTNSVCATTIHRSADGRSGMLMTIRSTSTAGIAMSTSVTTQRPRQPHGRHRRVLEVLGEARLAAHSSRRSSPCGAHLHRVIAGVGCYHAGRSTAEFLARRAPAIVGDPEGGPAAPGERGRPMPPTRVRLDQQPRR